MNVRKALKEQYHSGLDMLKQCVVACPAHLWTSGKHPRTFWRIAFHNIYFTHLYLGQNEESFEPWPGRRDEFPTMWAPPWDLEPYELPEGTEPYSPESLIAYLAYVDGLVDPIVDSLDLDSEASGFRWYKNVSKISHQLMNLRHLQGHVGQLSELLMAHDIDLEWTSIG